MSLLPDVARRIHAVLGAALVVPFLAAAAACSASDDTAADPCRPGDADGVTGGKVTVLVSVSDTGFAVGGVGSGSSQRNITIQNSTDVTLILTNVGTRPHSFVVDCIPTDLPEGCAQTSCLPGAANISAVAPGDAVTTKFRLPLVEGTYPYSSDVPGDEALTGQFVVN